LCLDNSKFSEANLAIFGQKEKLVSTAKDLKLFNFREIYHDGAFAPEDRSRIVAHRNAEIVVPRELDLSSLRYICCRSRAEKETLLHLLPPRIVEKWGSRIYVKPALYKRNWAFIETVFLDEQNAVFEFSPDARVPEPFDAKISVKRGDVVMQRFRNKTFKASGKAAASFRERLEVYEIEFLLDEHIAYSGRYDRRAEERPF